MDFLKSIFGGSESEATSTPIDMTPGAFKDLREPFAQMLSQWATSGGPQYTGPLNADMTAAEGNILGGLQTDAAGGTGRQGLLTDTMSGKYVDPASNPFLNDYIKMAQRQTLQGLEETLGRVLPGRFTQAGQLIQANAQPGSGGSSAFDRASAIATRGASDALGDIATKISAGAYESERGRQQEAVKLSQEEVKTSIANLQAQSLPRMIQELGIERGMQLFQERTTKLLEMLKLIGGVTSPTIANQSTATSENYGKGIFGSLFPNGLSMPK